jgi:hypothetical protein
MIMGWCSDQLIMNYISMELPDFYILKYLLFYFETENNYTSSYNQQMSAI